MRQLVLLFFVGFLISLSSCRKDFDFEPSSGNLRFSRDTVYLDTVFTNIGSSTYTLKVYNQSDKDISIPQIKLAKGLESKYRMTVDGMTGNDNRIFENVELLANDSMYIFIEVTADVAEANPDDFLYTDQIEFGAGSNLQKVELVTLIQDAVFLYPKRNDDGSYESINVNGEDVYGFVLDENDPNHGNEFNMTAEKPYVIYGYALVPGGKTLTVQPGARIHCHADSGIFVNSGGAIQAGGIDPSPENQVVFEGDRLEPDFSNIPGQWFGILFAPGSAASSFNHVTIKNANVGLWVQDNPAGLILQNTQIYDCSFYGIWGNTAHISGENVVINNAGRVALACNLGGSYEFTHCTFNNNWPSSSQFAVAVDNFGLDENNDQVPFPLTKADFNNCIIYSSNSRALSLKKNNNVAFEHQFNNCLLKFNNTGFENEELYNFGNGHYPGLVRNQNPNFWDVNNNKLNIDETSKAIGIGDPAFLVPNDILNVTRTLPPDAGAYQHAEQPEED